MPKQRLKKDGNGLPFKDIYDPLTDLVTTVSVLAENVMRMSQDLLDSPEKELKSYEVARQFQKRIRRALTLRSFSEFKALIDKFNKIVEKERTRDTLEILDTDDEDISAVERVGRAHGGTLNPLQLVSHLVQQTYLRVVSLWVDSLQEYKGALWHIIFSIF